MVTGKEGIAFLLILGPDESGPPRAFSGSLPRALREKEAALMLSSRRIDDRECDRDVIK